MSSFFSKFRSSKPSKKKANANQNVPPVGGSVYSSSNNSSQVSLGTRSYASNNYQNMQQARPSHTVSFPQATPSTTSFTPGYSSNTNVASSNASLNKFEGSGRAEQQQNGLPPPLFMRQPFIRSALVKGRFQTIVELPKYVDQNEWLALNLFEFYGNISQFVTMLSDYIDQSHIMNAGAGYDYLWIDTNKQAVRLPAATYINYTMSWISVKFDDPTLFPTRQGVPFPPNFPSVLRSIYIQLFRIFAYIFYNQYEKIVHLSLEAHFNSLFCHFASFGKKFHLLDQNEMAPLLPLIQNLEAQGKIV